MKLAPWLRLVRFAHTVFALPFALMAAWLAAGGLPAARALGMIVLCAVLARTAAMAFNRWLDREIDRANPRTAGRELPRGILAARAVLALVFLASAGFVLAAFALNPLCGKLSFPVLAVLLAYSAMKRVTWLAHVWLGVSLGLAPLGAWLAVRGDFSGDLVLPLLLALGVTTWVAGFDLIYACQDVDFDRRAALRSFPARFGVAPALRTSSVLHGLTFVALALLGLRAELGLGFAAALALTAVLLVWQHRIVAPDDLSRVDLAFFTLNGWISIGLFVGTVVDVSTRGRA
jgi:4-hydroxybenzoate polyprenyltransferase